MSAADGTRLALVVVGDTPPWFAAPLTSRGDRRRLLEDERSRLLALAVGDHLPVELALRVDELTTELRATEAGW